MNEKEIKEMLDKKEMTEEDLVEFMLAMQGKGMQGSIMTVSDPDSEEGLAAKEYIKYHDKLPKTYPIISKEETEGAKKVLLSQSASIEDKKKALIILAHTVSAEAYKTLEEYEKNPDEELKVWINLAIQECGSFLKNEITGKPEINITKVTKIGRNEPCPCGSGRKYKKCCINN